MPLPWKKVKSARISRLVNDHLHNSQKRRDGSSLVVETGFPTSLIDLFIKNREKLKTQSKKKRRNPPNTPVNDVEIVESPPSLSPPQPPPPSIADSPLRCPSPLHNLSVQRSPSICESEVCVVDGVCERDGNDERAGDVRKVLFGVFKVSLVVVLGLWTKRLAVGITISAFLLLFLEYVGKHLNVYSCSIVPSVLRLSRLDEKKSNQVVEIQIVDDIQETEAMEEVVMEKKEVVCNDVDVLAESKKKLSRGAKMKLKMKKYVPRKFRSSRKLQIDRLQVDQCNNNASIGSSEAIEEAIMKGDEKGHQEIEGGVTWRHLLLCVIVLIGLMGGRAFALGLTLSCFLILKLGDKLLPRYMIIIKGGSITHSSNVKSC